MNNSVDTQVPEYLNAKRRQESALWRLWYRLSSPSEPEHSAPFKEQERFRRGRTGSQIIFGLFLLLFIAVFTGFVGSNEYLFIIIGGAAFLLLIATGCNRMGFVNLAGILVVLTFVAFPMLNIVLTPDGLSILILPLYGLLVLPLLCAAAFLPPWSIFLVALTNSLFTWASLAYLPRTAELNALLSIALVFTVSPIICIQIIISIMTFVWVQSTTQALLRANRAEEIARLEHDLALQAEESAREKHVLEASTQKIMEVLARGANGDYSVRVPFTEDNVLWGISGHVNNLLARMQRMRQSTEQSGQNQRR